MQMSNLAFVNKILVKFRVRKLRSLNSPKILLHIFEEETSLFHWSVIICGQSMYRRRNCCLNLVIISKFQK